MNGMLMGTPHARRRPPLPQLRRHVIDDLPHDFRPAGQLIKDRFNLPL
jgi:hypothetical protein